MNISEINIYPIKSLRGIALENSLVENRGLQFDRRWMLTDLDGMFFTQREVPKMAAVSVTVNGGGLKVSAEGFGEVAVPHEPDSAVRQTVTIWDSQVQALAYRGAVNEWLSEVLARRCQIVLMPEASERHVNKQFDTGKDTVSFADGYPLLLIGEGSLEEVNLRILNTKTDEERENFTQYPMNRFRPNLVVKGSEPFAEDRWRTIRVGEAMFRVAKPCARCVITTVDQTRGEFDGKDPLKTLATFRLAKQVFPETFEKYGQNATGVLFGENLIPENPGVEVRVGDEVSVIETR